MCHQSSGHVGISKMNALLILSCQWMQHLIDMFVKGFLCTGHCDEVCIKHKDAQGIISAFFSVFHCLAQFLEYDMCSKHFKINCSDRCTYFLSSENGVWTKKTSNDIPPSKEGRNLILWWLFSATKNAMFWLFLWIAQYCL